MLANRLKFLLPSLVDENQSAFVPGRLIIDNVLLSSEVLHFMSHNQAKKRGFMALELDMSKAYDRMKWDYLACVLINMGFPAIWIDCIMSCVTSVKYSFLVIGVASEVVEPQSGLRQGDPLSPYLFFLCAEGLVALLKKAYSEKTFTGISIARNSPILTHLFFADDSLIFARADARKAEVILNILKQYEALSGHVVNLDKCEVSFSKSLGDDIKRRVRRFLGFKEVLAHDKDLGLQLFSSGPRISPLLVSKTEFRRNSMDGRKNCSQKRGRKF